MPKKLLLCIALFALAGCGTTPPATDTQTPTQIDESDREPEVYEPTAEEWLQAAREATRGHDIQLNLLRAATAFLDDDRPNHAGAVLIHINSQQLRPEDIARLRLQRARFYATLADWRNVREQLQGVEQQLTSRLERVNAMQLNYQALAAHNEHFAAGTQLIRLEPYLAGEELTDEIWEHLRRVPADIWRSPPRESDPNVRGWYHLLSRLTEVLDQRGSVANTLEQWQRDFPRHNAQRIANELLSDSRIAATPRQVAVLLPLTGQFANQGEAVYHGILAALTEQGEEDVRFIDTSQFEMDAIADMLAQDGTEVVIGPLDRATVDRFNRIEDRPWLQLGLNHPPQERLHPRSSFFALDIAAETRAAAEAMHARGHRGILLLGPDTNRGRQLSQIFTRYWHEHFPPAEIRTGYYSASNEMRDLVRERLHVQASEARKDALEALFDNITLEQEFRSRQDIDAIYLLGDGSQARLLKPFIDVSISAFGQPIPVYANSTVNEQIAAQGERDLDGVRLLDAPWLLPGHERQDIREQLNQLLRGWNRDQQRLTAMGYDSIRLAPRLALMQHLNGYSYSGLSGQLRIENELLVRELSWAIFDGDDLRLEPITRVNTSHRN
ncbi:MAG: penicillin-binding protein activator [Idiomarina sp.]|nr:penicillin-binding protein activator [Idiomarina sp.]